jgi:hypothetical protein
MEIQVSVSIKVITLRKLSIDGIIALNNSIGCK